MVLQKSEILFQKLHLSFNVSFYRFGTLMCIGTQRMRHDTMKMAQILSTNRSIQSHTFIFTTFGIESFVPTNHYCFQQNFLAFSTDPLHYIWIWIAISVYKISSIHIFLYSLICQIVWFILLNCKRIQHIFFKDTKKNILFRLFFISVLAII